MPGLVNCRHQLPLIALLASVALVVIGCDGERKNVGNTQYNYRTVTSVELAAGDSASTPSSPERTIDGATLTLRGLAPADEMKSEELMVAVQDAGAVANLLVGRPGSRAHTVYMARLSLPESMHVNFLGTISNQTENAIRFTDAAVTVMVDGKLQNLDQVKFKAFREVTVPPKAQVEFLIPGPHVAAVQAGSTISVGIYDLSINRVPHNVEWSFAAQIDDAAAVLEKFEERRDLYPQEVREIQLRVQEDAQRLDRLVQQLNQGLSEAKVQ